MMQNRDYYLSHGIFVDKKRLTELLKAFYSLTHIKISFYDKKFIQLETYPPEEGSFCQLFRKTHKDICLRSDCSAFSHCEEKKETWLYTCPAGLIEMIVPLLEQNRIIGYIMFGQMMDRENLYETQTHLREKYCNLASSATEFEQILSEITLKSREELSAITVISRACADYILHSDLVHLDCNLLIERIDEYITEHLSEGINIDNLCAELHIRRSTFYSLTKKMLGCNIGDYISEKKIEAAKILLQTTDLSISNIACAVGFSDYNYFLRYFKRHSGSTCNTWRKQHRSSTHTR